MVKKNTSESQKSVLKAYYGQYLREVRGNKESTVKHYYDALNNVSRRLKEKNIVKEDIYEIADLNELFTARDVLMADASFIDLDTRGNKMYSSGLKHYCQFAAGEGFNRVIDKVKQMDIPIEKVELTTHEQSVWKRSNILRTQALSFANYQCEIDAGHMTFIAESTGKQYMEGHHAIPMKMQDQFDHSLDIYANLICLCPICHRRIHYAILEDRKVMMEKIYFDRADRLAASGIILSKEEFIHAVV